VKRKKDAGITTAASSSPSSTVRLDKWLWAARFFKTRTLAHEAVEGGRVFVNGARVKPSRTIEAGTEIHIRLPRGDYVITVVKVSDKRVSGALAAEMFTESEESKAKRLELSEMRRLSAAIAPDERPNTQDRRLLRRLKEGGGG
jgi:ribosome-associated heat shock protein Hsp15